MSDLYDRDIVEWSAHQTDLLRRIAAGEAVNEAPDWFNIAEEIESVGSEQHRAVESLLLRAILHLLKIEAWPQSRDVPHWRSEARLFRAQARRRFVPSMRQRLDVEGLYADALRALPEASDGLPPLAVSSVCTMTLDGLLEEAG